MLWWLSKAKKKANQLVCVFLLLFEFDRLYKIEFLGFIDAIRAHKQTWFANSSSSSSSTSTSSTSSSSTIGNRSSSRSATISNQSTSSTPSTSTSPSLVLLSNNYWLGESRPCLTYILTFWNIEIWNNNWIVMECVEWSFCRCRCCCCCFAPK